MTSLSFPLRFEFRLLALTLLCGVPSICVHAEATAVSANDLRLEIAFPLVDDLGDDLNPEMSVDLAVTWQRVSDHPEWYLMAGLGPGLHISLFDADDYYAAVLRGQLGGGYRFPGGSDIRLAGNLGAGVGMGEWMGGYDTAFLLSYGIDATYLHPVTDSFWVTAGLGVQGRMADHRLSVHADEFIDVEVRHFYPRMILGVGARF